MRLKEFLDDTSDDRGGGDGDPGDPNFLYDMPMLKKNIKRLSKSTSNPPWFELQLKTLLKYMEQRYLITDQALQNMFAAAPSIYHFLVLKVVKNWPSNEPPNFRKNTIYRGA